MSTKTKLVKIDTNTDVTSLVQERDSLVLQLNNATNAANYFLSSTLNIEDKIKSIFPDGLKLKSLWWIWNNRKKLVELVEYVLSVIREVKDTLEKLKSASKQDEPNQ